MKVDTRVSGDVYYCEEGYILLCRGGSHLSARSEVTRSMVDSASAATCTSPASYMRGIEERRYDRGQWLVG